MLRCLILSTLFCVLGLGMCFSVFGKNEPWLSGYFRDGVRRVDYVLVLRAMCPDEAVEIQIHVLLCIADIGLDVEVEPGVGKKHRNLVFVKLHAREEILDRYGDYFGVRKYYKCQHEPYMQEGVRAENELITIIRRHNPKPGAFSTMERSLVVYRMLRAMSWNKDITFDLESLIHQGVLLDAYALHDGPYFLMVGQFEEEINGRQALFYAWLGWANLFKGQPTHIIREYYGERLACVFAFWESLLKLLVVLSILSAAGFIIGMLQHKENHSHINEAVCNTKYSYAGGPGTLDQKKFAVAKTNLPVCPKCDDFKACPMRFLDHECVEVRFKNILDSPALALAALCAAVAGWIFFFKWWSREDRFRWIWEVSRHSSIIPRMRHYTSGGNFGAAFVFFLVAILIAFIMISTVALYHKNLLRNTNPMNFTKALIAITDSRVKLDLVAYVNEGYNRRTYVVLAMVGMMNGTLISVLNLPCRWLAHRLSNHRRETDSEWSLMLVWTGFSFVTHFSVFFFYGVLKGSFYTWPLDPSSSNLWLGLGQMNCGVMGCFDELFVVVVATAASCRAYSVCFYMLRSLFERSDYGGCWGIRKLPCWEREYRMKNLREDAVMEILRKLMMKYMHSIMLFAVIPLAPFVVLAVLLWDIRLEARRVLMFHRRPLLLRGCGLGVWRWLLAAVPFVAGLFNALVFALNTNMFERLLHKTFPKLDLKHYIPEYSMSFYPYANTFDKHSVSRLYDAKDQHVNYTFCLFPGKYRLEYNKNYNLLVNPIKYCIHWHQALFVLCFQGMVVACGAVLWYVYWEGYEPADTQEWQAEDDELRSKFVEMKLIDDKKCT